MVKRFGKHTRGRLRRTNIADDDEANGEGLQHHSADEQSRQAVAVREWSRNTSLVRYEDILPVIERLSTRAMVCQYLTLGMTVMVCVYMFLMIVEPQQWLSARPGYHDNGPWITIPEPSQTTPPHVGAMREVPGATVVSPGEVMSSALSRGKDVQRLKNSTASLDRHDGISRLRSRHRPRQRVRVGPKASPPSSSQSSRTVLFPGTALHKDSQGRVDYWLVRREDGRESRMVPVDVTQLGVVFRDMDSGQAYLVTYEGEWTNYRPH